MTENIILDNIESILKNIIDETPISNLFTKLLPIHFSTEVKIGFIDLLTQDKVLEEFHKKTPLKKINKDFIHSFQERSSIFKANLICDLLFIKNTPLSPVCQNIISILNKIDPNYQKLLNQTIENDKIDKEEYQKEILKHINVKNIYIPVNPFKISESSYWLSNPKLDIFYKKYLLLDNLFDINFLVKNQNYFHNNFIDIISHDFKRVTENDIIYTTRTFTHFYFNYLKNWISNIINIDFLYLNLKVPILERDYQYFTIIFSHIIKPLINENLINKPIIINIIDSLNDINNYKKFNNFINNNFNDLGIIFKNTTNNITNMHLWGENSIQKSIPNIWDELILLDKQMRKDALEYLLPRYQNLIKNNFPLDNKKMKQDVYNILGGNWDIY